MELGMRHTILDSTYSTLKEEETSKAGWKKDTLNYIMSHKSKIYQAIKAMGRCYGRTLQHQDIEDIFESLTIHLYQCNDWDPEIAIERSKTGTAVSVDGYVHVCTKYCVMKYVSKMSNIEKNVVHDTISDAEGRETSLFSLLTDNESSTFSDDIVYELKPLLEVLESDRYSFGPDLYLILYSRLQVERIHEGLSAKEAEEKYRLFLSVLGVSKRNLDEMFERAKKSENFKALLKAIIRSGLEEASREIEKYVYAHESIKRGIATI